MKILASAGAVGVAALLLTACSGGSGDTNPPPIPPMPSPTTHRSFSVTTPAPVKTIKPGTTCAKVGDHAVSDTSVPYSCVRKGDKLRWTADKVHP